MTDGGYSSTPWRQITPEMPNEHECLGWKRWLEAQGNTTKFVKTKNGVQLWAWRDGVEVNWGERDNG
jgi:hypothetical protein